MRKLKGKEISLREKAVVAATVIWEAICAVWNFSYQTVISDPYNAAKLSEGEIAIKSSLFPWPINKTGHGPFHPNVPRDLTWEESIVHNFLGHPAVRVGLIILPIAAWICYNVYKVHKLEKGWMVGEENEYVVCIINLLRGRFGRWRVV